MSPEVKTFTVKSMHCEGCENRLKDVLGEIPGVRVAEISYTSEKLVLEVTTEVSIQHILNRIKALGFKAKESR
ncbi:MAG: heavy-metal-associated domain-containing protein [Symbiobacteriaceae bacterium]|nr:heavy-metal-associated domain-containing protein [Symbiobacteriaceae bacterium]